MKETLFGTDGIRSAAGDYPLDEGSLRKLGAIIASLSPSPRILVARDTRESGPAIEAQLARGFDRRGQAFSAGVLPTPGLAWLTRELAFDFGVMVSASHNLFKDNGIKLFDRRGEKLSVALENRINREFLGRKKSPAASARPTLVIDPGVYTDFLFRESADLFPSSRTYTRLAVDCANGAASRIAPALFRRLGLRVAVGYAAPDGRNINDGCGSTRPAALQELVRRSRAGLGLALDGDADRVIFADAGGRIIDGDRTLFLIARYLRETEPRFKRVVVGTVMSNLGLERALFKAGISFLRADVGDKHVSHLMKKSGAILGGEPSGHVILRHRQTTGDGLLTALYFMKALRFFACDAAAAYDQLALFPQKTLSIRVRRKKHLGNWRAFQSAAGRFAKKNGPRGRLLVRYSGTEPKIRIMIEARDPEMIEQYLPIFQDLVENEIGE